MRTVGLPMPRLILRPHQSCWHRWICRHGLSMDGNGCEPWKCARCGVLWSERPER